MPEATGAGEVGAAANEPHTALFHVNSQPREWRPGLTLAEVVREAGADESTVATALNGHFVARPARAATVVAPGDAVLLFEAIASD